jgi:hypothetical protein
VVTVLGDLKKSILLKVANSLHGDPNAVQRLMKSTLARDEVLRRAMPD